MGELGANYGKDEVMTLEEYNFIIDNKLIDACTEEEKQQVFAIAFGGEFMAQDDEQKGNLQEIKQ